MFPINVFLDIEYYSPPGERPDPLCMVAYISTGEKIRLGADDLKKLSAPPFPIDKDTLIIAYYAPAEMNCFLALGWELPINVIDLYAEYRCATNGLSTQLNRSLLDALRAFNIKTVTATYKTDMRSLAMRGGTYTQTEIQWLIDYCETDVVCLPHLFEAIFPADGTKTRIQQALLRGAFTKSLAHVEHNGIPIDIETHNGLVANWQEVRLNLIKKLDHWGIYDNGHFQTESFLHYVIKNGVHWPSNEKTGRPKLDTDTFDMYALRYPEVIGPVRDLRIIAQKIRKYALPVGKDGRNRSMMSPFGTTTGRNNPSTRNYVFCLPGWMRCEIKSRDDMALAYIDWEQQEFGIAAYYSQDQNMIDAYSSGDPYISFAQKAGQAPLGATKATHGEIREQYKRCALAVQYGQTAFGLQNAIGNGVAHARHLITEHKHVFSGFWSWSDRYASIAYWNGRCDSAFGWRLNIGMRNGLVAAKHRTITNFAGQANGAEMLRLACIKAIELGVRVCALVHDAILIEAPVADLEAQTLLCQQAMDWASGQVLAGAVLRTDKKVIMPSERFGDETHKLWQGIQGELRRINDK